MMLYHKFRENILNIFKVIEWTQIASKNTKGHNSVKNGNRITILILRTVSDDSFCYNFIKM